MGIADAIVASRRRMAKGGFASDGFGLKGRRGPKETRVEEGGCGVVGLAASVPVCGRNIFEPSIQMHNRGNGKGGGIAAGGLVPSQLGVSADMLKNDYILQVALVDPSAEKEIEKSFVLRDLVVDHKERIKPAGDYREFSLPVKPPDVVRYFVRPKENSLASFAKKNGFEDSRSRAVEDEFIYQNSFKINRKFYASLGEKRAFVLSHARDLVIFKVVGYAEAVVQYYGLDDMKAQVWIAHQRYPTKGRVWHPGGSHPFIGMNEALVHNGDFANYVSISDYLRQHGLTSQFLTDTEVSVLLFDLWHRVYGYPIEYVIEALAPTTEMDFDRLPAEKKVVYRAIQGLHVHSSPDGPWFFIVARSEPDMDRLQLLGITDTSMLRPQVFALQDGAVSVGLIASEKQAIDATLESLSKEDARFRPVADRYWNARGGSYTDGGAFVFNVPRGDGAGRVTCADKFGKPIACPAGEWRFDSSVDPAAPPGTDGLAATLEAASLSGDRSGPKAAFIATIGSWSIDNLRWYVDEVVRLAARDNSGFEWGIGLLEDGNNSRYDCGGKKRSVVLQIVRGGIDTILNAVPGFAAGAVDAQCGARRIDWNSRDDIRSPQGDESILVIHARDFPPEGDDCDARLAVRAYTMGWKRFMIYGLRGQRFQGCGFGPETEGVRIDLFGSSGDYLASGIDGMEIHVHDSAQDQLGQIMKRGTLVIHGDVGQTFMYGAKGGDVYVLGNAAGRPLINAVGRPRVIINGTCLDFLAESFMAGDPHAGGGFVVVNGLEFDDRGRTRSQATPYPGSNLFSLASGGAIFVRDPQKKLTTEQLNGGEFAEVSEQDWQLILPYLLVNERHFGISVDDDLLTVDGRRMAPGDVYRKVQPKKVEALAKEEIPE